MLSVLNAMFESIMVNGSMTGATFFAATCCSLVLGLFIAWTYSLKNPASRSFLTTLVLLPSSVQLVILLVNGNIGAGVAVAGAFSLVRFRSAAGKGEEITVIFLAMAVGLANGMGYLAVAAIFTLIITLVNLVLSGSRLGSRGEGERVLKITVPENLDYEGVYDDVLAKYTRKADLMEVKTSGMGSLYKLSYSIVMKEHASMKAFMDDIRVRNGNLEVSIARPVTKAGEL